MNTNLLRVAFWVWLVGIGVSGLNFFVLMNRVYEPRFGALGANQIGMTTRIVYIFLFATFLLTFEDSYSSLALIVVGLFWLVLTLIFEWGGSPLMRRPVHEILIGWHLNLGLHVALRARAAYALSPLTVGSILRI